MSQLLQLYKHYQEPPTQNLQPTFEDLSIDDNLSELQRLERYSRSAIGLQRLVHVKMMAYIAAGVGFHDTNAYILPLLGPISNDFEPAVRRHFMEQLALLAKFCCGAGGSAGYQAVIANILPVIATALEDEMPEVRHAACTTLVSISKLMLPEDLGQHVLTIVLQLAHEDDKEDRRMTAAELLNSLAESLGIDLCKQFVIPEVVSLAEDPVFRVRKSIALNFHNICKIGGEFELFERLMPAFVRLSKDDMYRVRRACADSIAEIAKYVSDDIRVGVLSEIYLRLAQDPSRLVKQSALQQSGMFIASLPCRTVNDAILGNFCSMAMSPTGDTSVDAELRRNCAFSFPAVLQTIGVGRWPEVRELYHALVLSRSNKVKQTLACSLHEVARILGGSGPDADSMGGTALVEAELIPVFESMLQDVEEVQMGVMRHLAEFLRMLSVPCRVSYLPLLREIIHSTNPFNWRLRQCLAVQVPDLLKLPPPELVFNTLYLLVITLLQDPVASVRKDSFTGVAKMMVVLAEHSDALTAFAVLKNMKLATRSSSSILNNFSEAKADMKSIEQSDRWTSQQLAASAAHHLETVAKAINNLIQCKTYQSRQLWVELSHALLQELPQALFEKYFLDGLLYLTSDAVSNVRVAVGLVLSGWGDNGMPTMSEIHSHSPKNADHKGNGSVATMKKSPWIWLLRRSDIRQCIMRLSCDDKDVYLSIVKLQPIFPDINIRIQSCKGLKEAPGGRVPVPNVVTGAFRATSFSSSMSDDAYATANNSFSEAEDSNELQRKSRQQSTDDSHISAEGITSDSLSAGTEGMSLSPIGSDKERMGGFGVKSPGRGAGVLAAAIAGLMQQQEEEIEQERLLHLKQSMASTSETADTDKSDISHGCLDALMRAEGHRSLKLGLRPRGMSLPGEIIYDDQPDEEDSDSDEDDEEEEESLQPTGSPIRAHSPVGIDPTKYAELNDSAVLTPTALSSSSATVIAPAILHTLLSSTSSASIKDSSDGMPHTRINTIKPILHTHEKSGSHESQTS